MLTCSTIPSVGNDHVPTFPSEPEPTKCETKTASMCSTTTSFVVSTTNGTPQTVSTYVGSSTCAEVRGCMVTDSEHEATTRRTEACQTATVTDMTISCSGSGTTACSTQTAAPKTGCSESVTASTTTLSCRASATGNPSRRAQPGDGGRQDACTEVREWLVWPKDGKAAEQTKSVFAKLKELVGDENKIRVSDNESVGVLYWSVMLEKGQEEEVKKMKHVLSLHPQCTRNCGDPTTQGNEISGPARDTHWRYQSKYIDEVHWLGDGRAQMAFLSQSKKEEKRQIERQQSEEGYIFDESVGDDIPVYIIDSGANLNHPDFQKIKDKVEWIHVGKDYDGEEHKDDSYLPVSQACPQVIIPFDPFEEGNGHKLCTSHGTSMLSFVTGNYLGTSKTIKPYLVRIPRLDPDGRGAKPSHWLDAVSLVLKRFPAKSDKTVAILSLAWHWVEEEYIKAAGYEQTDFTGWRRGLGTMIQTLIEHGVFVVTGAGNEFNMHGWPALYNLPENKIWGSIEKYRATWQYIPDLLVLGALDPANGQRWAKSGISPDYTYPELYAPGENIVGVVGDENAWPHPPLKSEGIRYDVTQGTSCDAPAWPPPARRQGPSSGHESGRAEALHHEQRLDPRPLTDDKIKTPPEKYGFRGIWNGSPRERVEKEGICPWHPGPLVPDAAADQPSQPPNKQRIRQENSDQLKDGEQVPLTGQCISPSTTMSTQVTTTTKEPPPPPPPPPPPKPTEPPRHRGSELKKWAEAGGCRRFKEVRPGGARQVVQHARWPGAATAYHIAVSWVEGCRAPVDAVDPMWPLAKAGDAVPAEEREGRSCVTMTMDCWSECNNGGSGGSKRAGCLLYEFKPEPGR
ncbi:hypothetical protein PG995_010662 [Apiospora arundinis]